MPLLVVTLGDQRLVAELRDGWTGQITVELVNGWLSKRGSKAEKQKAVCTGCGQEVDFLPIWVKAEG